MTSREPKSTGMKNLKEPRIGTLLKLSWTCEQINQNQNIINTISVIQKFQLNLCLRKNKN